MTPRYNVRVADRPDDRTIDLEIQPSCLESLHRGTPVSPGFALMLLHDRGDGDTPLGREVDRQMAKDPTWATIYARAFVESVELLGFDHEPPPEAVRNYGHEYWRGRERESWPKARLRIRATHPAWVSHVPEAWKSEAIDPAEDYDECLPTTPLEIEISVETDHRSSAGFLAVPKLAIVWESLGQGCPDVLWIPRHPVRAYEVVEPVAGDDVSREQLEQWLGLPVMWRTHETEVGFLAEIEDDTISLVTVTADCRGRVYAPLTVLEWIGKAAFRNGTARLTPPLQLEHVLEWAGQAATLVSSDGREATLALYMLARHESGPQLSNATELLRLLVIPRYYISKLGAALQREKQDREIEQDDELYEQVALGFIEAFEVVPPNERERDVDLDELGPEEQLDFIEQRRWPTWTVRVVVTDEAWLEHLVGANPWWVPDDELEEPDAWDAEPRTFDPELDFREPPRAVRLTWRSFELPGPVVRGGEVLPADDPRAVLRDHGVCEEVERDQARQHFEEACGSGNIEVVRAYLALGIDVSRHEPLVGETPLICAARGNQSEVVRMLAAAGADLDARDDDGDTALMYAMSLANPEVARTLVEVGASPDLSNNRGIVPEIEPDPDHTTTDRFGRTAWDRAYSDKNDEHMAMLEQRFEQQRIDALAEHGLGPDTAPESLEPAVFATLARRCDLESFRHWARKRQYALVRGLLRAGFDPNPPQFNRHGTRPDSLVLCHAAMLGDEQMVEILLEGNVDPNLMESFGETAINLAAESNELSIVRRLLAAGANPNVINHWGATSMVHAASHGNIEMLEMLVAAGALVTPRGAGQLPLAAAARASRFDAAQWLLAHGADIDARCKGRVTALHTAIEHNRVEIALALIAGGADVDVQTSDERRTTALMLATKEGRKGNKELIAALLAAGAKPDE